MAFTPHPLTLPLAEQPNPHLSDRLSAALNKALNAQHIAGAVILVAQNQRLVAQLAAGHADLAQGRLMTTQSVFRLASMAKAITSVTALALLDQGLFSLDDDVTDFLPDFRPPLADGQRPYISIRHLLTHTAGLDYGFFQGPQGDYPRLMISDGLDHPQLTLQQNMQRLQKAPLRHPPGQRWHYSLATDVLGALIERMANMPLAQAVHHIVTGPLGMVNTAFYHPPSTALATPYFMSHHTLMPMAQRQHLPFGEGEIRFAPAQINHQHAYPSGGAGMAGTAMDYLRFLEALRTGKLLKPSTFNLFSQNAIGPLTVDLRGPGWGFGLGVAVLHQPEQAQSQMSAGTWGWEGVYGGHYWVDPSRQLSVVIMTNTVQSTPDFVNDIKAAIYTEG